jgi:hypothetical protein
MRLDNFSQYYIRKLLRQHLRSLNCQVSNRTVIARCFGSDLNALVVDMGPTLADLPQRLNQIEQLIFAHQALTKQGDLSSLIAVERQLFEQIGLRLYTLDPSRLIEFRFESSILPFNFIVKNQICQGIRHYKEIYGLAADFKPQNDLRLHKFILILTAQRIPFVITQSPQRWAIWINLKSTACITLINYGPRIIDKTLRAHF